MRIEFEKTILAGDVAMGRAALNLQRHTLCSRLGSQLRANISKRDRAATCRINRPTYNPKSLTLLARGGCIHFMGGAK